MIAGGYAARPFGRISVEAEVIGFRGVDALGADLCSADLETDDAGVASNCLTGVGRPMRATAGTRERSCFAILLRKVDVTRKGAASAAPQRT